MYEGDPRKEGGLRLRDNFKEGLGGMNATTFGQTLATLAREGVLSKDPKKMFEETKGFGNVMAMGKQIFGDDASAEQILASARAFNGSVKPTDVKEIETAFARLQSVLDVTKTSAQEFFKDVQSVKAFAATSGVGISDKTALRFSQTGC